MFCRDTKSKLHSTSLSARFFHPACKEYLVSCRAHPFVLVDADSFLRSKQGVVFRSVKRRGQLHWKFSGVESAKCVHRKPRQNGIFFQYSKCSMRDSSNSPQSAPILLYLDKMRPVDPIENNTSVASDL
jgi:hypothetical protein